MSLRNEKADGRHCENNYVKKCKARRERRRAKKNPEVYPEYGRYHGWVS